MICHADKNYNAKLLRYTAMEDLCGVTLAGPPPFLRLTQQDTLAVSLTNISDDDLKDSGQTFRRLCRAIHIALISSGALNVVCDYHSDAAPVNIGSATTLSASPDTSLRSPYKRRTKHGTTSSSEKFRSPNGPLGHIEEDAVVLDDDGTETVHANVLQYLRAAVGLCVEADVVTTLLCNNATTERDIYDAFAATILHESSVRPTLPESSPEPTPAPVEPTTASSTPSRSDPAGVGVTESKQDTIGRESRNPLEAISTMAGTFVRSVASSAARFAGGVLHGKSSRPEGPNKEMQGVPSPFTARAAASSQPKPSTSAPALKVIILDRLDSCNDGVQRLVKTLISDRKIPDSALHQYCDAYEARSTHLAASHSLKESEYSIASSTGAPWWHLSRAGDHADPLLPITDALSLTSSLSLKRNDDTEPTFTLSKPPRRKSLPLATYTSAAQVQSPPPGLRSRAPSMVGSAARLSMLNSIDPANAGMSQVSQQAGIQAAAARFTPVPGIDTRYVLECGMLPPTLVGTPDLLPSDAEKGQFMMITPGGPVFLQAKEASYTSIPGNVVIIALTSRCMRDFNEVLEAFADSETQRIATEAGLPAAALATLVPSRPRSQLRLSLRNDLMRSFLLHIPVPALAVEQDVRVTLSRFADGVDEGDGGRHRPTVSLGQVSQASSVNELLSPQRARAVTAAYVRSLQHSWLRPISPLDWVRYTDEECGCPSVHMSTAVEDNIMQLVTELSVLRLQNRNVTLGGLYELLRDEDVDFLHEQLQTAEKRLLNNAEEGVLELREFLLRLMDKVHQRAAQVTINVAQSHNLRQNLILAVKSQALLELRNYVVADDVAAVVWGCVALPHVWET